MKKKILILGGGISKERLISLETAKCVFKELKKKNYKVLICEPDGNLVKNIKSELPGILIKDVNLQITRNNEIK